MPLSLFHLLAALASSTAIIYGAAAIGALSQYGIERGQGLQPASWRGLRRYLLPPELLRSRWTRLDIMLFLLEKLGSRLLPSTVLAIVIAAGTNDLLIHRFAIHPVLGTSLPWTVGFVVIAALLFDFISFFWHYLNHRVPLLWEFHKAHHARETLVPPAGRTTHPVEALLGTAIEALPLGLLAGSYAALSGLAANDLMITVIETVTVINLLNLSPLKHSHIEMRFGPLERVLLSPAHHQLHHSLEAPHWDKNFGELFAFWDRAFGTLHAPPRRSEYRLGLPRGESADYATLAGFYVTPIWRFGQVALGGKKKRQRAPF